MPHNMQENSMLDSKFFSRLKLYVDSQFSRISRFINFTIKQIATILLFVLHPKNAIFPLVVGTLFTVLLFDKASPDYYDWINECILHPLYVYIPLASWIIISIIIKDHENTKFQLNQNISNLEAIIDRHKVEDSIMARQLANKYGEFGEFSKSIIYCDTLKAFVNSNREIDSCQIYDYSIRRINDIVMIKVHCLASFAYEGVELNSITQSYFILDFLDYDRFTRHSVEFENLDPTTPYFSKYARLLIEDVTLAILDIQSSLIVLDPKSVQNKDYCKYRLLISYFTLWFKLKKLMLGEDPAKVADYVQKCDDVLPQSKRKLENELRVGKRTGILASILMQNLFGFTHEVANSDKSERIYVSFPALLYGTNAIVIYSSPNQDLRVDISSYAEASYYRNDFIKTISLKK